MKEPLSRLLKLPCKLEDIVPCKLGDTVYDIVLCDDGIYRIFKMKVCNINPVGDMRKGKVWNLYLEADYSKAYRSFDDIGRTVFFSQADAEAALRKMEDKGYGTADTQGN